MGQYFRLVNLDKKEAVVSYDIGGTAKFKEWLCGPHAQTIVWLLRQSNEGGGGDVFEKDFQTLGRWAGDRVTLIGDYDASHLYHEATKYHNISPLVYEEYNRQAREDDVKEELLLMRSPRTGTL